MNWAGFVLWLKRKNYVYCIIAFSWNVKAWSHNCSMYFQVMGSMGIWRDASTTFSLSNLTLILFESLNNQDGTCFGTHAFYQMNTTRTNQHLCEHLWNDNTLASLTAIMMSLVFSFNEVASWWDLGHMDPCQFCEKALCFHQMMCCCCGENDGALSLENDAVVTCLMHL